QAQENAEAPGVAVAIHLAGDRQRLGENGLRGGELPQALVHPADRPEQTCSQLGRVPQALQGEATALRQRLVPSRVAFADSAWIKELEKAPSDLESLLCLLPRGFRRRARQA